MQQWKRVVWVVLPLLTFLGSGSVSAASVDQVTTEIIIMIASSATLTLGTNTINFPDALPDSTPSIPASQNSVTVRCRITGASGSNVTLNVQANGNLVSGGNSIPINRVSWTATGTGYVPGTMNTTPVLAGSWPNTNGTRNFNGRFSYFLQNDWNYATGNYTAAVTYTLTAP
jgi:hypothetical protein